MDALTVVVLIFFVIGAMDYLAGNRFGLGAEFERGFQMLGAMALSMIGMIVIAPWLAEAIAPVFDWVYKTLHIDPSVISASMFANDMGGTPLSLEIAKDPEVGRFNALVVAAMMGPTVSFTIPFSLKMVDKQHHRFLATGLLCGVVTIPLGCLTAGALCGLGIGQLLLDLLPLVILAAIIAVGLLCFPDVCVKVFQTIGFLIKTFIVAGLVIGIINFLASEPVIPGMGSLEEGAMICVNASVVMTGMFTLLQLLSRLLKKPLHSAGGRLQMSDAGMMGLISSLATSMTTFSNMNQMDSKSIVLNSAFAVSGAFTFANHLAFTMSVDKSYLGPVILGKLVAGATALVLANLLWHKEKCAAQKVQGVR